MDSSININQMPDPFQLKPPAIAIAAALELQEYLKTQLDFTHNFGLNQAQTGAIVGKMFGILVVINGKKEFGYLSAFSGKLAGTNTFSHFVPPIYDALQADGFLTSGMKTLDTINIQLSELIKSGAEPQKVEALKIQRKQHSRALQEKLFDQYKFVNAANEEKGVREIFKEYTGKKPPAAAGECAAPKLFQYAFKKKYQPIAIAEFWWGQSPKSDHWKHSQFYPACEEKCRAILEFMLS